MEEGNDEGTVESKDQRVVTEEGNKEILKEERIVEDDEE